VSLDAREVKTKNSKSFTTFLVLVGDDIRAMFDDWVKTLTRDHNWGPHDPLFPATVMEHDPEHGRRAVGIKREHWTTTDPVRRIFRQAFANAGLPYFHPHSFRHTLIRDGIRRCRDAEQFKAFSQNVGHENVMTTFKNYGSVSIERQAELIRQLAAPSTLAKRAVADIMRELNAALRTEQRGE